MLFKNAMLPPRVPSFTFQKIVGKYIFFSSLEPVQKGPRDTPPTGLEPAIFGLGGRRVVHHATEADVDNTQ